jgi:hypothetical protein
VLWKTDQHGAKGTSDQPFLKFLRGYYFNPADYGTRSPDNSFHTARRTLRRAGGDSVCVADPFATRVFLAQHGINMDSVLRSDGYPPVCAMSHPGQGCVGHAASFFISGLKRSVSVRSTR